MNILNKIIIILFVTILIIRPYLPYIEYFAFTDYIIENFCENKDKPELKCNGKCHLAKQISKENQQPEQNTNPNIKFENDLILNYEHIKKPCLFAEYIKPGFFYDFNYNFTFITNIFHPPSYI